MEDRLESFLGIPSSREPLITYILRSASRISALRMLAGNPVSRKGADAPFSRVRDAQKYESIFDLILDLAVFYSLMKPSLLDLRAKEAP